ncbi:hypothetical protein [Streptomyces ortus]|uniref:Uncharacterized protein n=1 Tax=Streptomyces ortus TaxID=2867268 RepID=A0ABT3VFD2_9ACTN|nr:hypothetical protein [Streptomyces ortus]MCX4237360.1 hypothetical protein [Streptomyces ortus]
MTALPPRRFRDAPIPLSCAAVRSRSAWLRAARKASRATSPGREAPEEPSVSGSAAVDPEIETSSELPSADSVADASEALPDSPATVTPESPVGAPDPVTPDALVARREAVTSEGPSGDSVAAESGRVPRGFGWVAAK